MHWTISRSGLRLVVIFAAAVFFVSGQGCAFLTYRIKGVPAESLPDVCRAPSKRDLVPIDITRLAQPVPDAYRLDKGDTIGVIVDTVLPYRDPSAPPQPPPVHHPVGTSDLPPSIGTPVLVQVSGEVTLPIIGRVKVAGLTLEETSTKLKELYDKEFDKAKVPTDKRIPPVVTLFHARTYSVMVIREDTAGNSQQVNLQTASGGPIRLAAYKNDVLNALVATGGLPGLNAKNEVRIRRKSPPRLNTIETDDSKPTSPAVAEAIVPQLTNFEGGIETVIPLRLHEGTDIEIRPEDIILNEGDVVYIANRDSEVYYTGGLLPAGEHQLPRDRDIDIFEAMAIAGYSYAKAQNSGGGGGGGGGAAGLAQFASIIPTQLFILRKRADGTQYAIDIDLEKAINNERERLLIAPEDKLLLRYKPSEEVVRFSITAFFTYGIAQLIRR